ncbi:hypothetical protein B0H11DRAFT_1912958 [Mycena galericulata]|nr:hypothetical protein B0H11DRAFT_1912958 [Mycena galericulata]
MESSDSAAVSLLICSRFSVIDCKLYGGNIKVVIQGTLLHCTARNGAASTKRYEGGGVCMGSVNGGARKRVVRGRNEGVEGWFRGSGVRYGGEGCNCGVGDSNPCGEQSQATWEVTPISSDIRLSTRAIKGFSKICTHN